jgi:hypothetical protein
MQLDSLRLCRLTEGSGVGGFGTAGPAQVIAHGSCVQVVSTLPTTRRLAGTPLVKNINPF